MHPAEQLAQELDNPELAKTPGMVWQVWSDGEITLQKAGDLLWQRGLHQIVHSPPHYVAGLKFPHQYGDNYTYAFVASQEEALRVRELLEIKT